MAPRYAAAKGRGNGLASCKESEPGNGKLPWLRGSGCERKMEGAALSSASVWIERERERERERDKERGRE
jgi:hypothetical protein